MKDKKMKKTGLVSGLILSILLIVSCNQEQPADTTSTDTMASVEELSKGFQLLETNCFSCHSPNASIETRIAPPMEGIKRHYIVENSTNKEQFTKDLIAFLNNPVEENSKMPGAISKYGVMPKMNFNEQQITDIAHYIYDTELEKPDWFENHYQDEKGKYKNVVTPKTPLEKGLNYAMQTKGVLGKNLMTAIKTQGTEHALSFCSEKAYPLTDSMSVALGTQIKRVSDLNRNPDNKANQQEMLYIIEAKNKLLRGEKLTPQMQEIGNQMVGYYPITTNQMCLQCHGSLETDIKPNTLTKIDALYPDDKAVGYGENELRGIWVVEMEK